MSDGHGITIWSVCTGTKYDSSYVYALRDAVLKQLPLSWFRCLTDRKLRGIDCVEPIVSWPGWWQKLSLFKLAEGPTLYFDLDVIITGEIDYLESDAHTRRLSAPANWAQSGHGGIQSSVMAWRGPWTDPFDSVKRDHPIGRLWGDQEYLWELLGDDWNRLEGIGSYKYHVRPTGTVPWWMKVCVFHGDPKPHEVNEEWMSPYISIHTYRTRSTMGTGLAQDLSVTG